MQDCSQGPTERTQSIAGRQTTLQGSSSLAIAHRLRTARTVLLFCQIPSTMGLGWPAGPPRPSWMLLTLLCLFARGALAQVDVAADLPAAAAPTVAAAAMANAGAKTCPRGSYALINGQCGKCQRACTRASPNRGNSHTVALRVSCRLRCWVWQLRGACCRLLPALSSRPSHVYRVHPRGTRPLCVPALPCRHLGRGRRHANSCMRGCE